jgi:AraC family transcriptional regulator of adaptative response / methylphosphotriester-DNA alkyltransferase methyltransferase
MAVPTSPHSSTHRPSTTQRRDQLWSEAVAVIERRFAESLTVDDVASELFTSRRQLQRVFREVGNTTFRAFLTRVRMSRALEDLHSGPRPVKAIAHEVGYRQPAQFAKAFRRFHGLAPREARRGD